MGNYNSKKSYILSFEDMEWIINNYISIKEDIIIIHTLDTSHEDNIIKHTLNSQQETIRINTILNTNKNTTICIYGKNHTDEKVENKYNQLRELGFTNVFVYSGGLFEWLMLQELYGKEMFPTSTHSNSTKKEDDVLQYILKNKPRSNLKYFKSIVNECDEFDY